MSSNADEPEKYSLDDILDRLHSKPSDADESGQLVTRADGTQAIKVRKRKRRSTQPHKEAEKRAVRIRAFQISSAVVVVILLALTFGGLLVYANSAPYRKSISQKFSTATGAHLDMYQLRVTPTGSNLVRADLRWPQGNLIKSATLLELRAKALIGGLVGNRWSVDEMSVGEGTINITEAAKDQPRRFEPPVTGKSPVTVDRVGVSKMEFLIGDPTKPVIHIRQSEASLYPETTSGNPTVRLTRGDIKIPDWPTLRLQRSLLELHGDEVEVVSLQILHELDSVGFINLTGKFSPYSLDQPQELNVKLDSFNLNGVAGPSLGHLVSGRIDSRDSQAGNKLTFSHALPTGKLAVAFASSTGSPITLNGFQFLGTLSQKTGNPWFVEPTFEDGCTGILSREQGVVKLADLSLISRNHLKVSGDLTLQANDALSGSLQVGLSEATMLALVDAKLKTVFSESRDGFRWVTIKISGTGLHPTDNFLEIYNGSAAAPSASGHTPDQFDSLTAPK